MLERGWCRRCHRHIEIEADKDDRRTLAHAFSDTALRDIEYCVTSNVEVFCDQLLLGNKDQKEGWSEPKNMSSMANYLTFDILAELCFGKSSFAMLTKPDNRHIVELIFHNAWRCMIVSPRLPRS